MNSKPGAMRSCSCVSGPEIIAETRILYGNPVRSLAWKASKHFAFYVDSVREKKMYRTTGNIRSILRTPAYSAISMLRGAGGNSPVAKWNGEQATPPPRTQILYIVILPLLLSVERTHTHSKDEVKRCLHPILFTACWYIHICSRLTIMLNNEYSRRFFARPCRRSFYSYYSIHLVGFFARAHCVCAVALFVLTWNWNLFTESGGESYKKLVAEQKWAHATGEGGRQQRQWYRWKQQDKSRKTAAAPRVARKWMWDGSHLNGGYS